MIVEDRTTWWREIADHPAVRPHVMTTDFDMLDVVSHPSVTALRAEHGGFLFHRLDHIGRVYELHALFVPQGWGREVSTALKDALREMFSRGAQVVTVNEVEGWWRSRPPLSFGFRPAGDFAQALDQMFRTWILTRDAWEDSPACRRAGASCLLQ